MTFYHSFFETLDFKMIILHVSKCCYVTSSFVELLAYSFLICSQIVSKTMPILGFSMVS
jgi:hypothetical protein